MRDECRLFVQRHGQGPVVYRPVWIVHRRGIGLHQPDGLIEFVIIHHPTKSRQDIVNSIGLKVEVGGGDVEVIIVGRGRGISGDDIEKARKIAGVPEICERAQMYDRFGIDLFRPPDAGRRSSRSSTAP